MNYMGTDNMNMMTAQNDGGFQPATDRLTANQRMFVRNHPGQMPQPMNYYKHGCGGHNMNSDVSNNGNNDMMVHQLPPTSSNMQSMPTADSQTISLQPETMTNTNFLPAYLNQFLGHWVRAEFFINNAVEERVGVLHEVGASYIIIEAIEPQTLIVCDIFSLRFITIVLDENYGRLLRT